MRKIFFLLLLFVITATSQAQSYTLKGTITDSLEKRNTVNSVVALMRQSDSALIRFARADAKGNFSITVNQPGSYILFVTHPYMGDIFEKVIIDKAGETDLATIYLTSKTKLLEEVIVKSGSPIRIKGDTTIYTADSFKTRPGANVEELLRKLPGISVDREGKITAMGETVTKVLVDGEEFFGSDPGIATKNLRADAVQEVQVFDKKSEQAEFTGIDDGTKDKTINLKMKRNAGYFGKAELGGGLKDKYNNAIMLNSFVNKRKIAGYAITSNTGQTQLDWNDNQNYGGSDGMTSNISDDGGISIYYQTDDEYGSGRNGIPKNWNGGLHYSDKFGGDQKQSINTGYKFSKVNSSGITKTFSKTFLPDTSWNSNSISNNYQSTIKNALNATLEYQIDSLNSLKWSVKGNKRHSLTDNNYFSEAFALNRDSINNNTRESNSDVENNGVNSSLLWRHKFKKPTRTLSVNIDFNWSKSESTGMLQSLLKEYRNGVFTAAQSLDQQNINNSNNTDIATRLTYTEPLAKEVYLEVSYAFAYNTNDNERIINKKGADGHYNDLVEALSNSFEFNRLVHTPGFHVRWNKKKFGATIGSSVGFSRFVQKNVSENIKTNYNFVNFFPRVNFSYKLKPNENLRINYNGMTTAPSLNQLQPIRTNTDPLNEYIGNPDLEQSFTHQLGMSYSFYNVLTEKGLWTYIRGTITDNGFVQSSIVNAAKRTYKTVNASGVNSINIGGSFNFKITKQKIRLGIGPDISLSQDIDFVNNVKNISRTTAYGIRLDIGKDKENKYEFYFSPRFNWNKATSTINSNANARYWQIGGWGSGRIYLPKKFELSSDINVELRQKDKRFSSNNNFTIWNAALSKKFAKENQFELKLGIYDILNENRGFNRDFSSSNFTETFYNTLQRYWMLTFTWNITKNGKPADN